MIKNEVIGGRINFSSRCVIIPDPTLRADQIVLCYMAFIELFKYEIIAYLCKMDGITTAEAHALWYRATIHFNQKVYEIMKYLVDKKKVKVLVNRNPTLNYGSILCMRVKRITEAREDYTMSLPIQVLRVLNADDEIKVRL